MYRFFLNSLYRVPWGCLKRPWMTVNAGQNPTTNPDPATIPNAEMIFYLQTLTLASALGPDF
jgi:hypothetical protein